MAKRKALVLGSNATRIEVQGGGTGPSGDYLNETVVPMLALIEAGYELQLATPNGTKPHMDAASDSVSHFGGDQAAYSRANTFWADDPVMNQVRTRARRRLCAAHGDRRRAGPLGAARSDSTPGGATGGPAPRSRVRGLNAE